MTRHFTYEFEGKVSGGRLDPSAARLVADVVRRLDGKKVLLTLREWTKPRSSQQNRYWFGILGKYAVPEFRKTGSPWSEWTVHEHVMKALGYEEVLIDPQGKLYVSRMHSSEFTTEQWEVFMEEARAWFATEHGISLPLPNEEME